MKIITWNVNGIRAMLGKNVWGQILEEKPEVVCLQEIKAKPEQLTEEQRGSFDNFQEIWNPAEKPGYSGVLTLTRKDPLEITTSIGEEAFDAVGRVVQTRFEDFRLFNVYFPNGQRDHTRLKYKLDFYDHFLKMCDEYHKAGENLIICGDFNTAHQEIDLRNPKENQKTSGFLPEERAWISKYLEHGFVDVYRERYPEKVEYTWWTYRVNARARNVGWRLDYFMVSEGFVARVEDVVINREVMGSDHCPVTLTLT